MPSGYAAVGKIGRDVGDLNLSAAAVWMSDDGQRWRLVSKDLKVFGPTGTESLDDVTNWRANAIASGDFGLVVGGHSFGITNVQVGQGAIWHSADDGKSWVRVEQESGIFDRAEINDITLAPNGLVTSGKAAGSAAMWTSSDGLNWERLDLDTSVFREGSSVHELIVHDSLMIAVGSDSGACAWAKRI